MVRCVRDGACLCSRTWVLVVHNDFMYIEDYQRNGNDKDVENLRRVFQTQRKCQFAELANCNSSDIVGTLSNEQQLVQLFFPTDGYDPLQCEPEVFFLFILSHGKTSGEILTDHILDATDPKNLKFDTYKTSDVWDGLASLNVLKSCPKVLFFGPCRGENVEKKVSSTNKAVAGMSQGLLSSKPNRENFVILYATVESTVSNRHEHTGTWFVQEICNEMDNLQEDVDLLVFLMRVQNNVCHRNRLDKIEAGQTPQMHYFSHDKLTFCAAPQLAFAPRPSSLLASSEVAEESDCLPLTGFAAKRWEEIDARACNTENLLSRERSCFYEWSNERGITYQRGRALIFYDANHRKYAEELQACFCDLQYKTKLRTIANIIAVIESKRLKRRFSWDGSLVLCVLAKLRESELGLIVENGEASFQLSKIVGEFNGTKCPKLIGKPKLFFALDQGIKTDGNSKVKVEKVIKGVKISNSSADVCTFIGVGSGAKDSTGGLLENLTSALRSPQLKQGSSLQETLAKVIKVSTVDSKDDSIIKPQMISTLTKLVDFPKLENPYEPPKAVNPFCSFTIAGTIAFLCYALILMGIGLASISSPVEPEPQMLVFVNDSCEIQLSPRTNSSIDAFSLNFERWKSKNRTCVETWSLNNAIQEKISVQLSNNQISHSLNLFNSSKDQLYTLYFVILTTYASPGSESLTPLVEFSSALPKKYMRLAAYQSIFTRMESFGDLQSIEMLNFHYAVSKEEGNRFSQMLEGSKYTLTGVLSKFCDQLLINGYKSKQSKKRFSKFSSDVQRFFIPTIVKQCYYLPNNKEQNQLVDFANNFVSGKSLRCEFFKYLFLEMQNQKHLDNEFAGQLAEISEILVQNQDENTKTCQLVLDGMKIYVLKNCENGVYLRQFDSGDKTSFQRNDQTLLTIILSHLVKNRYNGNSRSATRLVEFFWGLSDFKAQCIGTRLLVEEMKNKRRLSSFEFLSLITRVKKDVKNIPNDCIDYSLAPGWMSLIFPNVSKTCDFPKNPLCTESVVHDLSSIVSDIKKGSDENRASLEILVVNFVIKHLQNVTSDEMILNELNLLEQLAEPFLNLTLYEIKKQFSTDGPKDFDLFTTIYKVFDTSLFRFYLPKTLQLAKEMDVEKLVRELELHVDQDFCFSIKEIYLEMANLSEFELIKLMHFFIRVEQSPKYLTIKKSSHKNEYCQFMEKIFGNFSESSIAELDSIYSNGDDLEDWIRTNFIIAAWVLSKFVDKVDMRKTEDAEKMLKFIDQVPEEYHLIYCPAFKTLLSKMEAAGLDNAAACRKIRKSKNKFWRIAKPILQVFDFSIVAKKYSIKMNDHMSFDMCFSAENAFCKKSHNA